MQWVLYTKLWLGRHHLEPRGMTYWVWKDVYEAEYNLDTIELFNITGCTGIVHSNPITSNYVPLKHHSHFVIWPLNHHKHITGGWEIQEDDDFWEHYEQREFDSCLDFWWGFTTWFMMNHWFIKNSWIYFGCLFFKRMEKETSLLDPVRSYWLRPSFHICFFPFSSPHFWSPPRFAFPPGVLCPANVGYNVNPGVIKHSSWTRRVLSK